MAVRGSGLPSSVLRESCKAGDPELADQLQEPSSCLDGLTSIIAIKKVHA